jgi:hypothetical protein
MKIKWVKIGDNDFKYIEGDYILRIEQMAKNSWWYCLYYKDEQQMDFANTQDKAELLVTELFTHHKEKQSKLFPNDGDINFDPAFNHIRKSNPPKPKKGIENLKKSIEKGRQ